ncbi:MAG TPA: hypothetical protein EYQ81_03340, partial [Sneathiellales bacterium]|nr:hypothetical protein [Sneathiellales bacterium]
MRGRDAAVNAVSEPEKNADSKTSMKIATATVILYLIEGAFGLPVFAKGGGLIYFLGPTSGYLFGFIIGA